MAKDKARVRRREEKNITSGVAHVHASFNNTMITITDADGAVYHYGLLEDKAKVHAIVQRHLVGGKPVAEYLIKSA